MNGNIASNLIESADSLSATLNDLQEAWAASTISINRQFPPMGYTLLHYAARASWGEADDDRLKYLLSLGPDLEIRSWLREDWRLGLDWTPLMLAVYDGTFDKVEMLLQAGANVNVIDSQGFTPLILAHYAFDREIRVDLILRAGASVEHRDNKGRTAEDHCRFYESLDSKSDEDPMGGWACEGPLNIHL